MRLYSFSINMGTCLRGLQLKSELLENVAICCYLIHITFVLTAQGIFWSVQVQIQHQAQADLMRQLQDNLRQVRLSSAIYNLSVPTSVFNEGG